MNVQAIAVGDTDLAGVDADALVLVTSAAHKARANGTAAEQLLAAAVKSGDLAQIGRAHV